MSVSSDTLGKSNALPTGESADTQANNQPRTEPTKMQKYLTLLKDFGYKLEGHTLIRKGISGFTSDSIISGRFSDAFDAATYLCPIIHDDEFTRRLIG